MRSHVAAALLLAGLAGSALPGCDLLDASHREFVEKQKQIFDRQKLDIVYQVAEQQYKVGDLTKCRETLKPALATSTPHARIRVLSARVELEGGSLELAAEELKTALAIDPNQAEPLYLLGVVYQRWQKFDTACDFYQQACEKNPQEALYVLAVAEMRITLGQLDKARQLLETKKVYFEQSAAMRVALARIAELQHDPVAASRYYRDASLLVPEDKNIRWTYAQSLYDIAKYSDAARILEELRFDPPTLPKSATLATANTPEDAATTQEAAKSVKMSILKTLGECYIALKRPMDARDCFQEILRAQPANVSAYLALARTSLMTDDWSGTVAAADKALRYDPQNVQAMILQAAVFQKQEKWTESLDTLDKAVRVAPRDVTVLCLRGISQNHLGRKDAATASFQQALAISPTDSWARELLDGVKAGPTVTNAQPTGRDAP
jgi:tetratricopeptide (TPR) repeat protein